MTDNEKLSCLIDRPCTACKFHKENGCSKWSCVFEEKSGVPKGEYIKKEDAIRAVYGMARPTGIDEIPYEYAESAIDDLPVYSIPEREKGEWIIDKERLGYWLSTCSKCEHIFHGNELLMYKPHFCSHCGADMRGGKE